MLDNIEVLTGDQAVAEGEAKPEAGFSSTRVSPQYNARLVEAANIWCDATTAGGLAGMRARTKLAESLTTSDFPILLGAVFDREMLAQYQQITPVWQGFARRTVVRDFRPKELVDLLGGRGILDPVGQGAEYPARELTEAKFSLTVGKRGARIPLTWEMVVNDDLDAFRDLPERLAQGARDTEDYLATSLLVTSTGANSAFFKSGNGNAATSLPLTTENLDAALSVIAGRKDSEGRPIVVTGTVLVVPPGLETQARKILNATELRFTDSTTGVTTITENYMRGRVTLVVNPWLPIIATDGKTGGRWFVLPAPTSSRPALTVGFLRGHETPDLRVKSSTGSRVGGGLIDPREGDFDDDTIQYRVRHVLGSAHIDPIATYVSNGS